MASSLLESAGARPLLIGGDYSSLGRGCHGASPKSQGPPGQTCLAPAARECLIESMEQNRYNAGSETRPVWTGLLQNEALCGRCKEWLLSLHQALKRLLR